MKKRILKKLLKAKPTDIGYEIFDEPIHIDNKKMEYLVKRMSEAGLACWEKNQNDQSN